MMNDSVHVIWRLIEDEHFTFTSHVEYSANRDVLIMRCMIEEYLYVDSLTNLVELLYSQFGPGSTRMYEIIAVFSADNVLHKSC